MLQYKPLHWNPKDGDRFSSGFWMNSDASTSLALNV